MLVVSRRQYESIKVGHVTVTIFQIERNRVRIGVEAPAGVEIARFGRGQCPPEAADSLVEASTALYRFVSELSPSPEADALLAQCRAALAERKIDVPLSPVPA